MANGREDMNPNNKALANLDLIFALWSINISRPPVPAIVMPAYLVMHAMPAMTEIKRSDENVWLFRYLLRPIKKTRRSNKKIDSDHSMEYTSSIQGLKTKIVRTMLL